MIGTFTPANPLKIIVSKNAFVNVLVASWGSDSIHGTVLENAKA